MESSTSFSNEGKDPFLFATLTPTSEAALKAFTCVVDAILQGKYAYQSKYVEHGAKKISIDEKDSRDEATKHEPQETGGSSQTLVWKGHYRICLYPPPSKPRLGWNIGSARQNVDDPMDSTEILLCIAPDKGVHINHARIHFEPSGLLMLQSPRMRRTVVDNCRLSSNHIALSQHSHTIRFGQLEYRFDRTLIQGSPQDLAFLEEIRQFFDRVLKGSRPITAFAATPYRVPYSVGRWRLLSRIGAGSRAVVYAASNITGLTVVVKEVHRSNTSSWSSMQNEISVADEIRRLLSPVHDENRIVCLMDVIYGGLDAKYNNRGPECLWAVYSPVVHNTFADFKNHGHPEKEVLATLFKHVLEGLEWLHSKGFVHRDIKPTNIGFCDKKPPRAVILDLACTGKLDETGLFMPTPGYMGTDYYVAPEMENEPYGSKVDIWAAGIVGYELFFDHSPWPQVEPNPWREKNGVEAFKKVHYAHAAVERSLNEGPEGEVEHLLLSMLTLSPQYRPSARECLSDPFITNYSPNPLKRQSYIESLLDEISQRKRPRT